MLIAKPQVLSLGRERVFKNLNSSNLSLSCKIEIKVANTSIFSSTMGYVYTILDLGSFFFFWFKIHESLKNIKEHQIVLYNYTTM